MRGVAGTARCGTYGGYSVHIKRGEKACTPCVKARDRYNKVHRLRRHQAGGSVTVDATGTRRRIQALSALGWPMTELGRRLGVNKTVIRDYCTVTWVRPGTARKVAALYEQLSGTPGPSIVARKRAVAKGWPPPLDWEGRNIADPRALSHSQTGDMLRAAHVAKKNAA